jgi:hypothetical protein
MEDHPLLSTDQVIPALAFMTFGIVIVYAIVSFFRTMKGRSEHQQTPLTRASEEKRARHGSIIQQ